MIKSVISKHQHMKMWADMKTTSLLKYKNIRGLFQMPGMGVSILSDGVGKPFSVRPATDDDLLFQSVYLKLKVI